MAGDSTGKFIETDEVEWIFGLSAKDYIEG